MRRALIVLLACGASARADVRVDIRPAHEAGLDLTHWDHPHWTLVPTNAAIPVELRTSVRVANALALHAGGTPAPRALAGSQLELGQFKLFGQIRASLVIARAGVGIKFVL
jgi:hypothetical protein